MHQHTAAAHVTQGISAHSRIHDADERRAYTELLVLGAGTSEDVSPESTRVNSISRVLTFAALLFAEGRSCALVILPPLTTQQTPRHALIWTRLLHVRN